MKTANQKPSKHYGDNTASGSNNLYGLFSSHCIHTAIVEKLNSRKPWKWFYRGFLPKPLRNKLAFYTDLANQNHIARQWRQFINAYFSGSLPEFQLHPKKQLANRKIIWQYWGQGLEQDKLPEIVRICFQSVDEYAGGYEIIRLCDDNLVEYLDLPDFVWEKKQHSAFKPAFFADLIRLALLDLYGGIWIDATVLLSAPIPQSIQTAPYFMFQRTGNTYNKNKWEHFDPKYFSWNPNHRINVLNSFIAAQSGNTVIHTLLNLILHFWRTQSTVPHYFFFQILYDELIQNEYADYCCEIIDDTLPHILQTKSHQAFRIAEWNNIIQKCSIHKMTYIQNTHPDSYYGFLKKRFLANTY